MSRNYANISTAIWRDEEFRALTIGAQHAYFLLATQPDISAAGALPLTLGRWASRASDSNIDSLELALGELVRDRFIFIDRETEELLVRSFVKWDGGYGNPKRRPVIERAAREIESKALRAAVAIEFQKLGLSTENLPLPLPEPQNAFPQENRLSDSHPDTVSASDGVVVTEAVVLPQPTTRIPQTTTPTAVAVLTPPAVGTEHASPPSAVVNVFPEAPINPVVPAQRWADGDRKPTTPTAVHGRTAALFPKPKPVAVETLPEAHQVIYGWLQNNGFASLGIDEVRLIHQQLMTRYGTKLNSNYLRAVIAAEVAMPYALELKKARHKSIADFIEHMRATMPQCIHGAPAGDQPHPTTGALLCLQCRNGEPAPVLEATTNPAVTAAVLAYRAAHGVDMPTGETILVAQQAEAFLAEGASAEDVEHLAALAGASAQTLIQAATRRTA